MRSTAGHTQDDVDSQSLLIAGADNEDAGSPLATNTDFKWGNSDTGAGGIESIDDVESVVKVPKVLDRQFQSWFMTTGKQAVVNTVAKARTIWNALTQPVHMVIHKILPSLHPRSEATGKVAK